MRFLPLTQPCNPSSLSENEQKKAPSDNWGLANKPDIMMHQITAVSNKVSNKFQKPIRIIGTFEAGFAIREVTDLGDALNFFIQGFQPVSNQLRSRYFSALRFFMQALPFFVTKPNSKSLFPSHSLNKAIVLQCNDSDSTITQLLISQKLAGSGKSHADHHKPERNIMNITFLWGQCHTPTIDSCTLTQTSKGAIA